MSDRWGEDFLYESCSFPCLQSHFNAPFLLLSHMKQKKDTERIDGEKGKQKCSVTRWSSFRPDEVVVDSYAKLKEAAQEKLTPK